MASLRGSDRGTLHLEGLPPLSRDAIGALRLAGHAVWLAYDAAGREGELWTAEALSRILDAMALIDDDLTARRLLPES